MFLKSARIRRSKALIKFKKREKIAAKSKIFNFSAKKVKYSMKWRLAFVQCKFSLIATEVDVLRFKKYLDFAENYN